TGLAFGGRRDGGRDGQGQRLDPIVVRRGGGGFRARGGIGGMGRPGRMIDGRRPGVGGRGQAHGGGRRGRKGIARPRRGGDGDRRGARVGVDLRAVGRVDRRGAGGRGDDAASGDRGGDRLVDRVLGADAGARERATDVASAGAARDGSGAAGRQRVDVRRRS